MLSEVANDAMKWSDHVKKIKRRICQRRTKEWGRRHVLLCCLWKERLPHRRQSVWDFVCLLLWKDSYRWFDNVMGKDTHPKDEVPMQLKQLQWNQSNNQVPISRTDLSSVNKEISQYYFRKKLFSSADIDSRTQLHPPTPNTIQALFHPNHPIKCQILSGTVQAVALTQKEITHHFSSFSWGWFGLVVSCATKFLDRKTGPNKSATLCSNIYFAQIILFYWNFAQNDPLEVPTFNNNKFC